LSYKAVITDIDGTILEKGVPVSVVIEYVQAQQLPVIILTNRKESERNTTESELKAINFGYTALVMNPGDDPAPVFKKSAVANMIEDGTEPIDFIDDSPRNREAVKSLGVKVTDPSEIVQKANKGEQPMSHKLDSRVVSIPNRMTLEQSLKALKAAFGAKSTEAESAAKELSAAKAKVSTQAAEISDLTEKLAAVSGVVAEKESLAAKVEELTKALAAANELKAQAAAQIETVGKVAAKIASSVGVAPAEISPADNVVAKSNDEIWSEYCAISNPSEKVAYYNKHRAAIVAHLGIK